MEWRFGRRASDVQGDPDHPDSLREIVARGTGDALDRRWRSMLGGSLMAGVLGALLVALPLTVLQGAATDRAARLRSAHNCDLVRDIAKVMGNGDPHDRQLRRGGFLSTDAYLRQHEQLTQTQIAQLRPGALRVLLGDPEVKRLSRSSAELDTSTTNYWRYVLIPRLLRAADADCVSSSL